MPTVQELRDEERKLRRVRHLVNFASAVIMQGHLTRAEAQDLVAAARARILELFPGQEQTYDIVYARRFARLIEEFTTPDTRTRPLAPVLPFPTRL